MNDRGQNVEHRRSMTHDSLRATSTLFAAAACGGEQALRIARHRRNTWLSRGNRLCKNGDQIRVVLLL